MTKLENRVRTITNDCKILEIGRNMCQSLNPNYIKSNQLSIKSKLIVKHLSVHAKNSEKKFFYLYCGIKRRQNVGVQTVDLIFSLNKNLL